MTDLNDFTETTNLTPATDSAADSAANSANDSYTAPGRTPHAHKAKRNRRRNGSFHKRMLWKDIRVTMAKSKGRFASIVSLMTLGSFALVGLFVTGPDMQITGTDFFNQNNLADITVISDYGLAKADENIIRSAPKWPRRRRAGPSPSPRRSTTRRCRKWPARRTTNSRLP